MCALKRINGCCTKIHPMWGICMVRMLLFTFSFFGCLRDEVVCTRSSRNVLEHQVWHPNKTGESWWFWRNCKRCSKTEPIILDPNRNRTPFPVSRRGPPFSRRRSLCIFAPDKLVNLWVCPLQGNSKKWWNTWNPIQRFRMSFLSYRNVMKCPSWWRTQILDSHPVYRFQPQISASLVAMGVYPSLYCFSCVLAHTQI